MVKPLRVLVACEFSGLVRDAFRARGHDAWSCDLLPTERPGPHYQGDVRDVLGRGWDLMVAHPPCTYLSNAGNVWIHRPGRVEAREVAMAFFLCLFEAPIPLVAVENPKGYPSRAFRKPEQVIEPYQFGHPARKPTCLWLRGLPLLAGDTEAVPPPPAFRDSTTGRARHFTDNWPGTKDRWKNRSRTFPGIAQAMADQWGGTVAAAEGLVA